METLLILMLLASYFWWHVLLTQVVYNSHDQHTLYLCKLWTFHCFIRSNARGASGRVGKKCSLKHILLIVMVSDKLIELGSDGENY